MANIALAGSEILYGIVQQSVFGTAEIDSIDLISANQGAELQVAHFALKNELNVRSEPAANGVRFKTIADTLVDTNEAMPLLSLDMPVARSEFLDLFLASFFQKVAEEELTPFAKTFTLPVSGETQQPDFSSDAGYFFTLFERHPTASRSRKLPDCISQSLTLSAEPSGKIKLVAAMVGRGAVDPTSDPTGIWTRYSSVGFHYAALARQTVDFGAGVEPIALKGPWEIALTQTVSKEGQDSGNFENYGLTERGGTFKIPIQDDANVMTAYANAVAGTALTINLGYGNVTPGSDDGDLDFTFTGKLTEEIEREKDGIMSAALVGELHGSDKSTSPITIIHANAIDRTWA